MRTRYAGIFFTVLSLAWCGKAGAGTVWTSPITNAVLWTKAGSPHTWGGSLVINSGGIITVEPGAAIQVPAAQHISSEAGAQILALGTPDDPIRIGGVSDTTVGGILYLNSSLTSQFRYCHFSNLTQIQISSQAPQANHLFEHCVFRKFTAHVILLNNAPVRILHCIFQNNATTEYGVRMNVGGGGLTDENVPTIWYNAFDRNGLIAYSESSSNPDFRDREFFRFNLVRGGTGVCVQDGPNSSISRVRIVDNDLSKCAVSFQLLSNPHTAHSVERCDVSAFTYQNGDVSTLTNLANNYWGTNDLAAITSRLFAGAASTNTAVPLHPQSWFPHADVDGSDGGNATTLQDADLVKQHLVGMTNLTSGQLTVADVDHNGTVDARDALIIESFVNGLIWKLPVP
jgi:hypothetical protein